MVAGMIRFHGVDIVGVQEALSRQLEDLDLLLPEFSRIGVGRDADGGGEYSAILYRESRFEVLDQGTFWLSQTPDQAGSAGREIGRASCRERERRAGGVAARGARERVGE